MLYKSCKNAVDTDGYEVREDGFKHCRHCGSMEPVELSGLITAGKATMSGSDWKYGWPHKFYVDVVNPTPDKQVIISRHNSAETGDSQVEYGRMGTYLYMKFYSTHLTLLDDETFAKVAPIISKASGVTWERNDKGTYYMETIDNLVPKNKGEEIK